MSYTQVKKTNDPKRTADRLLKLKDALAAEIPQKSAGRILLATWNIREF